MNCQQLEHLIKQESKLIPEFIKSTNHEHKQRYEHIRAIFYILSLCIDNNYIDYTELIEYDDAIKNFIELLEDSCENDKSMMFIIWNHVINGYENYIELCVNFELYESASNLQKIKCLYNGE